MNYTIAVAGKGGTGKTTLAALLIFELLRQGRTPILAVDADPNANLGQVLGVQVTHTIGSICDQATGSLSQVPQGMTKEDYLELHLQRAVHEASGFDLLSMGRPEGPGCYCYVNNLIRRLMGQLASNYPIVVIDNEAGLEHLSRRTTRKADLLLLISDSSLRGLQAAKRITELVQELKIEIGQLGLIVNRLIDPLSPEFTRQLDELGVPLLATIPYDSSLSTLDGQGQPLVNLPVDAPAAVETSELIRKILR